MKALEEHLYQYIDESLYQILLSDGEYQLARTLRDEAERRLASQLNKRQKKLLSRYMDEENRLLSIQNRRIFQETLHTVHQVLGSPSQGT